MICQGPGATAAGYGAPAGRDDGQDAAQPHGHPATRPPLRGQRPSGQPHGRVRQVGHAHRVGRPSRKPVLRIRDPVPF